MTTQDKPAVGPLSAGDVKPGHVYVEVSGLTGTGKSAVMGEIEIALKALGLTVEHDSAFQAEKNGTHADWQEALDLYKPVVVLRERNVPRLAPTAPVEASASEREGSDHIAYLEETFRLMLGDKKLKGPIYSRVVTAGWRLKELKAALRPQPSGETREDAEVLAMLDDYADRHIGATRGEDMSLEEMLISKARERLSVRPLALGGQQGVKEKGQ